MIQKKNILFLCSPSLGLLDSWISVLVRLKKKAPETNFIFIATRYRTISEIDLNSFIYKEAKYIFNTVIFKSKSEVWMKTNSFLEAKELNNKKNLNFMYYLYRLFIRINFKKTSMTVLKIYGLLIKNFFYNFTYNLKDLEKIDFITLFDLYELDKIYNNELYDIITKKKNYSIIHGINPFGITFKDERKSLNVKNSFVFALSKKEVDYYKKTYGLHSNKIKVCGIPRHETNWLNYIISKHKGHFFNREKFIFLISRPVSSYLPLKRKKNFLIMIKNIAEKLSLKIIIKLHPKEKISTLYYDIFESKNYGFTWEISSDHQLIIGKHCEFAISFFSSLAIDLIYLNIPTIELLDLKGLRSHDNENSLRDNSGNPVLNIRFLNLVLGASNYEELEYFVNLIKNDKTNVMKKLQVEYNNTFPRINNVNEIIANDIFKDFSILK